MGSEFFGKILGFEEVGLRLCWLVNKEERKNEFFGDDVKFEVVGSCEYVNKEERLPFGAIVEEEEEEDDKTADAEAAGEEEEVLITIWIPGL